MTDLELLEELRDVDEITLLELLEITSEDIVDRFYDLILERSSKIIRALL